MVILYIGPGVGVATILLVLVVLSIVALSFAVIMWGAIKKLKRKIKRLFTKE